MRQQAPVATATPTPSQFTPPIAVSPVVLRQVLRPVELGWNRTVTLKTSSFAREKVPPPETIVKSVQVAAIVPASLPDPSFSRVKDRSANSPTTTCPKSRLVLSIWGIGGSVGFSVEQLMSDAVRRRANR
jgi:hypothetical protein